MSFVSKGGTVQNQFYTFPKGAGKSLYNFGGFEPEYRDILNFAKKNKYFLPSGATQIKQNELIRELKVTGIWSGLDIFYNFYTDGDGNFSTINWVNPETFLASKSGSPIFTVNKGWTMIPPTNSILTGWAANVSAINFT